MKLKGFQKILASENIDLAILVSPDPSIAYFTQQNFSQAVLLLFPKRAHLFHTQLDAVSAPKSVSSQFSASYLNKNWEKELSGEMSEIKARKIGLNYSRITVADFEKFQKMFSKAAFIDISKAIQELRSKKTQEEVSRISRACRITSAVYQAVISQLSTGKFFSAGKLNTEQAVASFLETEIKNRGAEIAFPSIVAIGKNAAVPHHLTGNTLLKRGFLLLDFGARHKNYCADMTRMVFLGKPTKQEKAYYDLLLNCQLSTLEQIRANKQFSQLEDYAKKKLGKYSHKFIHSLGHGIGIEVHEAPLFKNKAAVVEKNQAFTIEPGIYFKGKFGLRIEDTLVFDGRTKVLTKAAKDLIVIPTPK